MIDFRHEQSAAFAAIGWAKATREPGVCALTAGCGVTNGMSAIASAQADGVPLVTLGGRAPEMRWGSGSLQEIDHLPFVRPLVKSAQTVEGPGEDRPDHRRGDRHRRYPALRPHLRRLSAGRRLHGGRGEGPGSRTGAVQDRRGSRGGREAAGRGAPSGDHGRLGPLLGPGGVRAAGTGRGARHPRLPQRPRPRLPPARPRALLLPRSWLRSQGMRRRPGDRRAARLPPRLWRLDRRGGEADPARLRAAAAREDPAARSRPRRGHRRHPDARSASQCPTIPGGHRPGSCGSGRSRQ